MSSGSNYEAEMDSYMKMIGRSVQDTKQLYTILEAELFQNTSVESLPIMLLALACCRSKLQNTNDLGQAMRDIGVQMNYFIHDDRTKEMINYVESKKEGV